MMIKDDAIISLGGRKPDGTTMLRYCGYQRLNWETKGKAPE